MAAPPANSSASPWPKSVRALASQLDDLVRETVGLSLPPVDEAIAQAGPAALVLGDCCPRCGDSIGEGEAVSIETGCVSCRDASAVADRVVRLGSYEGALRELILGVKFQRWWEMGRTLGRMLGDRVAANVQLDQATTVVVPVPMPWQRRMFRGIDHARVIASGVAETLDVSVWAVLAKTNGSPQLALTPSARARLGGRGLRIRPHLGGWSIAGWNVVLVDDVRTTGATIRRAVRLLRTLKPRSVVAAVLAVADHESRRSRADQSRPEVVDMAD